MINELLKGETVQVATVGELKALLADLPDDMELSCYSEWYTGGDYDYDLDYPRLYLAPWDRIVIVPVSHWVHAAHTYTDDA